MGEGFTLTQEPVWSTVPHSTVTFTSEGGPLLITLNLSLKAPTGPQYFTCRPMVDNVWAGWYGGYPDTQRFVEGVHGGDPDPEIWYGWEKSRVYTGIPLGNHTLTVQCMKVNQYAPALPDIFVGNANVVHSVSVIEFH